MGKGSVTESWLVRRRDSHHRRSSGKTCRRVPCPDPFKFPLKSGRERNAASRCFLRPKQRLLWGRSHRPHETFPPCIIYTPRRHRRCRAPMEKAAGVVDSLTAIPHVSMASSRACARRNLDGTTPDRPVQVNQPSLSHIHRPPTGDDGLVASTRLLCTRHRLPVNAASKGAAEVSTTAILWRIR